MQPLGGIPSQLQHGYETTWPHMLSPSISNTRVSRVYFLLGDLHFVIKFLSPFQFQDLRDQATLFSHFNKATSFSLVDCQTKRPQPCLDVLL